jgi:NAD(P)-dependent dehydrogenase (short-subunit alcohol dehydrogenase family)
MNDEGKTQGVVTSVVVPSTIDTPQNRKAMPNTDFNRWIKPEEIADTIYYYSSETAKSIREPVIKIFGNS